MTDLQSKNLIYLKGLLFLIILLSCSGLIVYETRSWKIALLLALTIWSAARVYYFMFYVIERYVDPGYKFSGIYSFVLYLFSGGKK